MKFFLPAIIISCVIIFSACKKDNDPPGNENMTNAYFPLKMGNYWVYEFKTILPDGTDNGIIQEDSLVVVGETLIDNNTYWKLETNKPVNKSTWFLRDSAGYILNNNGSIILPPTPRNDIYNAHHSLMNNSDTIYYYWDQFPNTETVTTAFGDVNALLKVSTHISWPDFGNQTIADSSYFAGFGPVQRSYAYLSGAKMIGTLTEYHLEN